MEALGFVVAYRLAMATTFGSRAAAKVEPVPVTDVASPGLLHVVGQPQ